MSKTKRAYGFAVLIFICGILVGACAMNFYQRIRWQKMLTRTPSERAVVATQRFFVRYEAPIERRENVAAAFGLFFENMSAAQQEFGAAMQRNHQELVSQMQKNLPPEIFSAWHDEQQKSRDRRAAHGKNPSDLQKKRDRQ